MILMIDTLLTHSMIYDSEIIPDETIEEYKYIQEVLRKYSVYHKLSIEDSRVDLIILEQKICIDEYEMTKLFDYVLDSLEFTPKYKLEYISAGHEDFTLHLTSSI